MIIIIIVHFIITTINFINFKQQQLPLLTIIISFNYYSHFYLDFDCYYYLFTPRRLFNYSNFFLINSLITADSDLIFSYHF